MRRTMEEAHAAGQHRRSPRERCPLCRALAVSAASMEPSSWVVEGVVDRQHVSRTNREVLKAVRAAMARHVRTWPMWKAYRKRAYRMALARHAENRRLYVAVMTGRLAHDPEE